MAPTPEDEQIARELSRCLVEEFHPRRVVWFGSRAQGCGKPDSDWDVLVVADTDLGVGERLYRARQVTREVRVAKDILVVTPAEHARLLTWQSSAVYDAERTGRVLHEAA